MNIKKRTLSVAIAIEIVVIIAVHLLNINHLYSFVMSEDELGYWGNAAFLLGKDWGNTVSFCQYYSFGYSIFLMLIQCVPLQGLTMYRLAILANALFMAGSFLISYFLFTRLMPEKNKILISVACMGMTLYSAYICQSSIAWSECYLVLFVWLILLQAFLICQKATMVRVIVFALELGYSYMIHQRTIPFLIAGIVLMIVLIIRKRLKICQFVMMVVTVAGMLAVTVLLKDYLQAELYNGTGAIGNDYSNIISKMTIANMIVPVIREAAGQFYYLWASTFGIVPLGIGITIITCIKKWKRKEADESCFLGFTFVSFLGILGVSSIFMRQSILRVDYLIYGRYIEIAIGFFLIMGLLGLEDFVKQKKCWLVYGLGTVVFLGLAFFLLNKIQSWNIPLDTYYQGACAVGTFWFYSFRGFRVLELSGVVILASTALFFLAKFFSKSRWILILEILMLSLFWVFAGRSVLKYQINPYQKNYTQVFPANDNLWKYIVNEGKEVVFLSNIRYNIRGSIQLYMQDQPLMCRKSLDELEELPDILILDNDSSIQPDYLFETYELAGFLGQSSVYALPDSDLKIIREQSIPLDLFAYQNLHESESGCAVYGPYMTLNPGTYEVTFSMDSLPDGEGDMAIFDVVSGENVYGVYEWDGGTEQITLQFQLEERTSNIEFRYYKNAGNDSMPEEITLRMIQ